jgi:JmjC domain
MSTKASTTRKHEGPADHDRALARCVVDPDGFVDAWGVTPLLASAAELSAGFGDLLDLEAIDELLSRRGLRTPFLRMAKDGVVVDSSRFTRGGGVGAQISDQVDDAAVLGLFADGTTIVLQALHRLWPPLIDFARRLHEELGHPVQINAYVTPPSSRGFSAHYDVHDVFVLQIAGEKRWIVHEPVHRWPLRTEPWTQHRRAVNRIASETAPLIDAVLRPGDALYLPRGFVHSAEALGDVSAHLTVGIHVVTRQALAEALLAEAGAVADLRRSLPVGLDLADPDSLADEIHATVGLLVDRLRATDAEAITARLERALGGAMRPEPVAPIAQAAAATSLAPDDRVRLRSGVEARLESGPDGPMLRTTWTTVRLDPGAAVAATTLLEGREISVDALDGPPDSVAALVRTLLLHGVLVPASQA